jgi:hypothetical protein
MAKIIATTFGGVLILIGLLAAAFPAFLGMHGCWLGNLLDLGLGAALAYAARKAGPSILLASCFAAGVGLLVWGVAGMVFGHPAQSSLAGLPPDLQLLVLIPGALESGRTDHLLHLFLGVAFGIAGLVCLAESPLRLRR